jgi:hypothetical protein
MFNKDTGTIASIDNGLIFSTDGLTLYTEYPYNPEERMVLEKEFLNDMLDGLDKASKLDYEKLLTENKIRFNKDDKQSKLIMEKFVSLSHRRIEETKKVLTDFLGERPLNEMTVTNISETVINALRRKNLLYT